MRRSSAKAYYFAWKKYVITKAYLIFWLLRFLLREIIAGSFKLLVGLWTGHCPVPTTEKVSGKVIRNLFLLFSLIIFALLTLTPASNNSYESERLTLRQPLVNRLPFDLPPPAVYPVKGGETPPPNLTAASALVIDLDSARVLFAKNPDAALAPASTTKIMTALVALDIYQLTDVLTVNGLQTDGNVIGLVEGEKITVENLLYGLLVKSGNDAAFVLAANHPQGYEQFIYSMNKKAESLSMFNTRFSNSSGMPVPNHYTTARDFSYLAAYALKNPIIEKIVQTKQTNISSVDSAFWHNLENTNALLGQYGVDGIKTGWTEEAGQCLVASATQNGHRVVSVVLDSTDRFGETASLLTYIFSSYRW